MLVGFSFSGLGLTNSQVVQSTAQVKTDTAVWKGKADGMEIFSLVCENGWALMCAITMSCNILVTFIATLSAITGSGMALRGSEGSVLRATVYMEQQHKRALRFFGRFSALHL